MTKGDRIRQLREKKSLTQEDLARLLNTKRQTISKYEKNIVTNIPSDKLEELAKVLGTTPEYILGWDEELKESPTAQTGNEAMDNAGYYQLNEENKAFIDQMIEKLLKTQSGE